MDQVVESQRGAPGGELPIRGPWVYSQATADRVYVVDSGILVPGAESGVVQVEWQRAGLVIAAMGCSLGDGSAAGMASLAVKATVGDWDTEVFTDGNTAAYASFAALFGPSGQMQLPMYRRVRANTRWSFFFKNYSASQTFRAQLTLGFRVKG